MNKSFLLILATASLLTGTFGTSSSAVASELVATQASSINTEIIASASTCPKYAGGGILEAQIETRNFSIYICKRSGKLFYTSTSKLNGKGIRSLSAYSEEGTGYIAKNGKYEYVVNGVSLEILKNGKVLQTDPVIKYVRGNSN
ncbi:hypothetical protein NIES4075_50630 [Tolypothrix sp. NIES-4075]|uniref:hypothetical protein n=1 Tax=Tolypothrix sp. NIES-4075 TaxID=2005459 RepID=UPI000B5CA775|nr:hypothetical protein [Tolypothrix sp. NIES-4075]GAX44046.1 hypothetical protein NIES4075_50630 [Tolypothrix sp. NIES-4075]